MAPPAVPVEYYRVESSRSSPELPSSSSSPISPSSPSKGEQSSARGSSPSSPDEIELQHASALKIVQGGICYNAEKQWEGEIPLSYKKCPVCPDGGAPPSQFVPCWSTRGHVDITALQALVQTGYNRKYKLDVTSTSKLDATDRADARPVTSNNNNNYPVNYWDPLAAAVHNVPIRRPSHDAWGIPKIVLLFCDDFCQDCYELPWWWQTRTSTTSTTTNEGFAAAIQPVLALLQIPASRVVRMLLASLPAGATIPVHHDTGEWVKHTHRVHVPVLVHDESKILFRCGASVDDMQAIRCTPGHVFEINNQAKHAVSNCDSDHRVHLILDYVDEDFLKGRRKERIRLQPGETLLQTRRSIDRLACKGQRPTPSFMILGAQKAGTTYLFELIMQHPLLIKPKDDRRETHCLDWRWNETLKTTAERVQWCHTFYHWQELQRHPSCVTGDSTPSYLLDSARVIPRIREVFPHNRLKFFVTCRDPVQRAASHYAMVTSVRGTPAQMKARGAEWKTKSFDQVVAMDLRNMIECGLLPYWTNIVSIIDDINNSNNADGAAVSSVDSDRCTAAAAAAATFNQAVFDSFAGSVDEDAAWNRYLNAHVPLHTGSYGLLTRGLYELQLRPWFRAFDPADFLVLKLEALTTLADNDGDNADNNDCIAQTLQQVWEHLGVPPIDAVADMTPKNTRDYEPVMSVATRAFLQRFYEPHNERLLKMLQSKQQRLVDSGLWERHWSESWRYGR